MPRFPRVAMPTVPAKFDLRITDIPGPSGTPIPHMEWEIVRAANVADAFTSRDTIVKGESDTDGKVLLSGDDEVILKQAYDDFPNQLWVLYAGQARELIMTTISPSWTNQQKWQHALDAMGYSDQMWTTNGEITNGPHESFVRKEVKISSGAALLKKIERES